MSATPITDHALSMDGYGGQGAYELRRGLIITCRQLERELDDQKDKTFAQKQYADAMSDRVKELETELQAAIRERDEAKDNALTWASSSDKYAEKLQAAEQDRDRYKAEAERLREDALKLTSSLFHLRRRSKAYLDATLEEYPTGDEICDEGIDMTSWIRGHVQRKTLAKNKLKDALRGDGKGAVQPFSTEKGTK